MRLLGAAARKQKPDELTSRDGKRGNYGEN